MADEKALDRFVALGNAEVQKEYRGLCDELARLRQDHEKVVRIEKLGRDLGILKNVPTTSPPQRVVRQKSVRVTKSAKKIVTHAPPKETQPTKRKATGVIPGNGERIAIQLELLRLKATAKNGKIPSADLASIAKHRGVRLGSVSSLLATTQGKYRPGFLRRLVNGLSKTDAIRKLLEVASLYGKNMMPALQQEAGL